MTFLPLNGGYGGPPDEIALAITLIIILISWGLSALVLALIQWIGNVEIKRFGLKSLIVPCVVSFLLMLEWIRYLS